MHVRTYAHCELHTYVTLEVVATGGSPSSSVHRSNPHPTPPRLPFTLSLSSRRFSRNSLSLASKVASCGEEQCDLGTHTCTHTCTRARMHAQAHRHSHQCTLTLGSASTKRINTNTYVFHTDLLLHIVLLPSLLLYRQSLLEIPHFCLDGYSK